MARKHEIEFFISEDGEIKFHIRGIKGPGCVDIAKSICKPLGQIEELNFTSEYYEKDKAKNQIRQKLG